MSAMNLCQWSHVAVAVASAVGGLMGLLMLGDTPPYQSCIWTCPVFDASAGGVKLISTIGRMPAAMTASYT